VDDLTDIFLPHWFFPELVGDAGSMASSPLPEDTVVGRGGKASAYDSSSPGCAAEAAAVEVELKTFPVYIVRSELIINIGRQYLL